MAEVEKLKSIKRFGARYGRTTKSKFGKIEAEQRRKHLCPYCSAVRVKRLAVGIWNCEKCGAKFTGKAYSVKKKVIVEEEAEEAKEEIMEENKEVSSDG